MIYWFFVLLGLLGGIGVQAMDLDWSGQFRAEAHWIRNYSMDSSNILSDPARNQAGGYYIPGGGGPHTNFQTLFMRLRPKLIVNDNVYLKSEWWLSDPIYGFFGSAAPNSVDQRQYYSTQSRGSTITAQRFWAEFLSDAGTVQVGRAPLHWGLGIVWNSGERVWDRYVSTGDVIRLVSKFGAFSMTPAVIKYTTGNTIGGACNFAGGLCTPVVGGSSVMDYSLIFKYENPDEDFEGGVNFVKRIAGAAQDSNGFLGVGSTAGQAAVGMNFNTWDLYGKKKFSSFTLAGEIPITSGDIGGIEYKTFAVALEGHWNISDSWETSIRAGQAPGQPNSMSSSTDKFRAFYFNPNYHLGLILFNYQLANFSGLNTLNHPSSNSSQLASPFNNPIVNAQYLALGGNFKTNKWNFRASWLMANAREKAVAGMNFFNTWGHRYFANASGKNQDAFLGWEADGGATFQWDDSFRFDFDFGWFFPGDFFKFSNSTLLDNETNSVFAAVFRAGVMF